MSHVALDANFLIALAEPAVELGAAAGELAGEEARLRLQLLWERLSKAGDTIIVPTPALAEAMVKNPARVTRLIERMTRASRIKIEPFGSAAAMEAASLFQLEFPRRKERRDIITRSKLKFDLQIVAIARVAGCSRIYSTDRGLRLCAERALLPASGFAELDRPDAAQLALFSPGTSAPVGDADGAPDPNGGAATLG